MYSSTPRSYFCVFQGNPNAEEISIFGVVVMFLGQSKTSKSVDQSNPTLEQGRGIALGEVRSQVYWANARGCGDQAVITLMFGFA